MLQHVINDDTTVIQPSSTQVPSVSQESDVSLHELNSDFVLDVKGNDHIHGPNSDNSAHISEEGNSGLNHGHVSNFGDIPVV
ncbi:hypothetical protein V6N12_062678 [Hibiscus sabdariffa]|uniref:Uncharacterized protein n=1 Tax=Hibiscus sabdariffa TaxID=183260 RepID=A0ABR2F9K7_9ROSI